MANVLAAIVVFVMVGSSSARTTHFLQAVMSSDPSNTQNASLATRGQQQEPFSHRHFAVESSAFGPKVIDSPGFHDKKIVGRDYDIVSLFAALSNLIWIVLFVACATIYKLRYKQWPEVDQELAQKPVKRVWSTGPFDCFADLPICLWSCFCPVIRWADTADMLGYLNFWVCIAVIAGLNLFIELGTGTHILGAIVVVILITWSRQKMRKTFGFEGQGEFCHCFGDCLFICCCMCCSVAQEARHVEDAARADHEAVKSQRPTDTEADAPEAHQMAA